MHVQLQNSSITGRQFLVSGGDGDGDGDDLVMSADRTAKLPLGSVATLTVRGCEPAYYALLYSPLLLKKNESASLPHTEETIQRGQQNTWWYSR